MGLQSLSAFAFPLSHKLNAEDQVLGEHILQSRWANTETILFGTIGAAAAQAKGWFWTAIEASYKNTADELLNQCSNTEYTSNVGR